ncbi:hypothetical protein [Streptomyces sp. NPDC058457]
MGLLTVPADAPVSHTLARGGAARGDRRGSTRTGRSVAAPP